jgi:hypothetical protein
MKSIGEVLVYAAVETVDQVEYINQDEVHIDSFHSYTQKVKWFLLQ